MSSSHRVYPFPAGDKRRLLPALGALTGFAGLIGAIPGAVICLCLAPSLAAARKQATPAE